MTQETKPRPINRLKAMYPIRALQDENLKAAQSAKEEGKPVAWSMMEMYATPFFNAQGLEVFYPENYASVCAALGAAQPFLDRSEAEGFPNHLCGYAQTCIGYAAMMMQDFGGEVPPGAPQGGMLKPALLLSSGLGCDARFKWFQALGRYLNCPQWVIESAGGFGKESLMEGSHEAQVQFMIKQLRAFAVWLERVLGEKMDWDKFSYDIDAQAAMNAVWWEVNEIRKAVPGPMHARDFWSSMNASLFRAKEPDRVRALYQNLLDEVNHRVENKIAGINYPEKYRLMFIGLPPWHGLDFFDQLAERGWNFVTEGAYHTGKPRDWTHIKDPVERWVRMRTVGLERALDEDYTYEEACQIKEEIRRGKSTTRLQNRGAREFRLDGAVLHPLLTCRATTAGQNAQAKRLMEDWKVPALTIEGDIIDTRLFNRGEALRKAEAFEETMDHYRRVRREEGLEW